MNANQIRTAIMDTFNSINGTIIGCARRSLRDAGLLTVEAESFLDFALTRSNAVPAVAAAFAQAADEECPTYAVRFWWNKGTEICPWIQEEIVGWLGSWEETVARAERLRAGNTIEVEILPTLEAFSGLFNTNMNTRKVAA